MVAINVWLIAAVIGLLDVAVVVIVVVVTAEEGEDVCVA
jgi:hypothetical protein